MPVSSENIIKFLEAKTKNNCPRCGNVHWAVSSRPSTSVGMWLANESGEFGLDSNIANLVLVFCKNCGFSSIHVEKIISDWVDENAKSSEAGERDVD